MVTEAEVREAHRLHHEHLMFFAPWLQIDVTKGGDPEFLVKVRAAAMSGDPAKYERALAHPKTSAMLNCGAIYFKEAA